MTGVGVRWTAEEVLTLAPDDASRKAGTKLSWPDRWSEAGAGSGGVWGLCKGSSSAKPYRTVVDLGGAGTGTGPGFKCSCPSRKFPCKHALGLLLLWAGELGQPDGHTPPDWAGEWLDGRRERAARKA
ncbi:SWIM zinc finger family protein, partial [Streptomyces albidus (ex Kaewkla and Franco 2022)]|uniref:SWIM zinc finger family protein n=1 Tax=Streptomyces albidus (ex Kaewkla and Franco 2022) TaxID=722709 RepID=UPI0015EE3A56